MRTIIVLLTLFILLGFMNRPASSGITVKEFEQVKDEEICKSYIHGVGVGYTIANVESKRSKQKPLYCPPPKLAVTQDNHLRILADTIKEERQKGEDIEDKPVELILLRGLQKTFPCEK